MKYESSHSIAATTELLKRFIDDDLQGSSDRLVAEHE